ncbi:Predicted dehydrogenase [Desulfonatronum zhilinae]|nr:Predicted dehydrogenase [Desulfonatronum zhilinae]
MTNQCKIKAAVIGLGVGAHQARCLSTHPDCELAWLCDLDGDRLSALGAELPEARLTSLDQDVLSDPDIDLVCVASYDEAHHCQVVSALEHGKNVYVEKPMCLSREETLHIRSALRARPDLRLSSNLVLRTTPLFGRVRSAIQSQELGEVYHLEADYLWGRKEKIISGWRAEAGFYSIIHGAAVHMVDLLLWITGKRPVTVQALGSRIAAVGSKQRHNDFAVLLLGFADQTSAKISAHGGCVHPHFHALKVFGTRSTFLHETSGTVWIDSSDLAQPLRPEHDGYPAKQHRGQALISFVDALFKNKSQALVPQEDVFAAMSVCLAAEQAVQSGKIVDIEYL